MRAVRNDDADAGAIIDRARHADGADDELVISQGGNACWDTLTVSVTFSITWAIFSKTKTFGRGLTAPDTI